LGSLFSAIWIVVANSWQQTPAGYHIVGAGTQARAEITDFWSMVFNPSSIDRLLHVWLGAFLAGAFLVISVHSYYLVKKRYQNISLKALQIAIPVAITFSLLQLVTGHHSASGVAANQPAKLAAMEGHFTRESPADLYLLGWVDQSKKQAYGAKIPGGLSLLIHGDSGRPIRGLDSFNPDDRPGQINAIFQFYHLMVAIGIALIVLSIFSGIQLWRNRLSQQKWLLWVLTFSVLLPQFANQFGWYTAEMGRQPWVVYGLLKTSDALSKSVTANQVLFSLILFTVVYLLLFTLFLYLLNKKIKIGPKDHSSDQDRRLTENITDVLIGHQSSRS
jgi:cytochrome d ubiquinol oxidase subunit I